ncbi:MAG: efflux RND transporter periplasmic adaptor subunit [Verrucomicrobiales bacterium]|nr:efflux RND transporter periplasmic adaptor subunit [Verrucomicrobiales bacterium]
MKVLFISWAVLILAGDLFAGEVVGVTEPVEEVELAFPEAGVIGELLVKEGDVVKKGQVLAKLDNRILEVGLKIAEVRASSEAERKSAKARLATKQRRLTELEKISKGGGVNADELFRAKAEVEITQADLMEAEVKAEENQLRVVQIQAQIERRTLFSPINGVVERTFRDEAEAVGGGADVVMKVARLDELILVVYVDAQTGGLLKVGQKLKVSSMVGDKQGRAQVAFVSPVTDASSGTTRVRLLLGNAENLHRSGVKYRVGITLGE